MIRRSKPSLSQFIIREDNSTTVAYLAASREALIPCWELSYIGPLAAAVFCRTYPWSSAARVFESFHRPNTNVSKGLSDTKLRKFPRTIYLLGRHPAVEENWFPEKERRNDVSVSNQILNNTSALRINKEVRVWHWGSSSN